MSFFRKAKLEKIIKKSISQTLKDIADSTPKVAFQNYYGTIEIDPAHLVIWYFFKTNADWHEAEANGLIEKIRKTTIKYLSDNGYPPSAFEDNYSPLPERVEIIKSPDVSCNDIKRLMDSITHYSVKISFASDEDVQNKTGGNLYYYFK